MNPRQDFEIALNEKKSKKRSSNKKFLNIVGHNWTNSLFFDRSRGDIFSRTHDELYTLLDEENAGITEDSIIIGISIVQKPLLSWLPVNTFLHHASVIIETVDSSYTIEKTTSAIHLRQNIKETAGHSLENIFSKRGEEVLIFDIAQQYTMRDILTFLHSKNSLNDPYHFLNANCQHFAIQLLEKFCANPHIYNNHCLKYFPLS